MRLWRPLKISLSKLLGSHHSILCHAAHNAACCARWGTKVAQGGHAAVSAWLCAVGPTAAGMQDELAEVQELCFYTITVDQQAFCPSEEMGHPACRATRMSSLNAEQLVRCLHAASPQPWLTPGEHAVPCQVGWQQSHNCTCMIECRMQTHCPRSKPRCACWAQAPRIII